jgi:hypothetical protein
MPTGHHYTPSLLTTSFTTHYSLLTTHYSLLTTHYSPLTTDHSLQVRYLQLTLRHHAAGAGGGKQRAEVRKADTPQCERESLESQEGEP